jgi:hypothetical protein
VRPDASLAQASRGYNDVSSARHRAQFKQLEAAGGIRRRPFFVIATVAVEAGGSQGQPAPRAAKLRGCHSRHGGRGASLSTCGARHICQDHVGVT